MDDETDRTKVVFELEVPKHLDTSQISVDVNPQYVRVIVYKDIRSIVFLFVIEIVSDVEAALRHSMVWYVCVRSATSCFGCSGLHQCHYNTSACMS